MSKASTPVRALGHRERLLRGMTDAAARDGYAKASVAKVIERAGVSRATFYEHFADKEDCFLAAYREVSSRMRSRVRDAAHGSPPSCRPRAVLEVLLAELAADPAGARLILVEALAAGPATRVEHERLIEDIEGSIESFQGGGPGSPATYLLPATALLGGVVGTLATHVFSGEGESLPELLEGLLAWLSSYAIPADGWDRAGAVDWRELGRMAAVGPSPDPLQEDVSLLPRGPSAVPSGEAGRIRRERILAATARVTAREGYAALTVADIVAAAHITRGAFYSHFRGKEEAFLAVQTMALQESIGTVAAEFFVASAWPERVWGAGRALLEYGAGHPDLAYLWTLEAHAAGAAAIQHQHHARTAYTVFLEEGYRELPPGASLPRICSEAIAGAIFALIRHDVARGRATRMGELLPQGAYVILAPFLGPAKAIEFVRARSQAAAQGR